MDLTKGASESTTTGTTTSATNNSNSNNHPQPHHEANLLLRLEFPEKIIPHGVALADSEDHEVLSLFVVTRDRHLYTISLRQEFFRRVAAIDENVPDWCKVSCPAPLAFAHPHRLHASSPQELFISLDSGALLRLTRKAGDDGTHYLKIAR